jgi:nucleotide-binding universal stress UspA family protein
MKKVKDQEVEHEKVVKVFMQDARKIFLDADFREQLIKVEIQRRVKGIARDIAEEAKHGYNIIMMGRTGTGLMKEYPLGTVTNKILGMLPSLDMCVVTGKPETKKVMVALDGSEGSMRAVDFLCTKLDKSTNEVIFFHAMRSIGFPETLKARVNPFEMIEKHVWEEARAMIETVIEKAKARLIKAGFNKAKIRSDIVTGVPSRAGALLEDAKQRGCGSVFVGRKGISQVEDFNIGRVCNKVIQRAENMAIWVIA